MSDETFSARRRGKIAQCPRHIREQINRMLDDGKPGRDVIAWANTQPEVLALVAEKFEGEPISDNNLSQWFKGGFLDWREGQTKVEETQKLAEFSLKLAEASGGSMAKGTLSVAAGKIMAALEGAEGETLLGLAHAAVSLRAREIDDERTQLASRRIDQRDEIIALENKKFQRLFVAEWQKWFDNEQAIAIAKGEGTKEVKMDRLMELMFGTEAMEIERRGLK